MIDAYKFTKKQLQQAIDFAVTCKRPDDEFAPFEVCIPKYSQKRMREIGKVRSNDVLYRRLYLTPWILIREIARLREKLVEWQPIETAPKDGKEFLVCNTRQGNVKQLVSWNKVHGFWQSKGKADVSFQWTHWMPLPEPPSAQA